MAENLAPWAPRGAWAGIVAAGSFGATGTSGVTAEALDGLGLATLIAPPDGGNALEAFVKTRLGIALPAGPRIVSGAAHDAIWAGPDQWLLRARSRTGFAALLADLSVHAAVSDQSDARALLRFSGPRVRDALAKGVMLDLHHQAFAVEDVALTSIAYLGVHLWRMADGADGTVFELAVARSMAGSFWSWFSASAAEYGCAVTARQS